MEIKRILLFSIIFIVYCKAVSDQKSDDKYKAYLGIQTIADECYDQGYYDSWNHQKPSDKDDIDYMEGYIDGKKERAY